MPKSWRTTVLATMMDPAGALARATKRYRVDPRPVDRPTSTLGWSFTNAVPSGHLPVALPPVSTLSSKALSCSRSNSGCMTL
eukprot:SAG22_NODE_1532_length_4207_cov_2.263632_5_plen_82_part_00